MMLDLIVNNAYLEERTGCFDIGIKKGQIVDISSSIDCTRAAYVNANNYLVTPPFVDAYFHLDTVLTAGAIRENVSGTLVEGIDIWKELKPTLKAKAIKQRAMELLRWSISNGILAIRLRARRLFVIRRGEVISHCDPFESRLDLSGQRIGVAFQPHVETQDGR